MRLPTIVLSFALATAVCSIGCGKEAQSASTTDSATLAVGKPAPDFDVTASDGAKLSLAGLKGKWVVVYFYPKDETPGCTKEACDFRDAFDQLDKQGVVLIGVSADSDESHRAFSEAHKLPFHLVSDTQGVMSKKFGVDTTLGMTKRDSFVIAPDGSVKKIYRGVTVSGHAQQIMEDVKS